MSDLSECGQELRRLSAQLDEHPNWNVINRIHHELAPLVGRLQAAVSAAEREHGDAPSIRSARDALDRTKAVQRQVGLDIRLASPAALALGLQQAIENALEVVRCLEMAT